MVRAGRGRWALAGAALAGLAACSPPGAGGGTGPRAGTGAGSAVGTPPPTAPPSTAAPATAAPATGAPVTPVAPVIVLDPGHSPDVTHTDPVSGLVDSDEENEPEMRDVFDVALTVRDRLTADGYRVVMTKQAVDDRVPLAARAAVAVGAGAALALSIHDQAGAGGIDFATGNNTVYAQSVGGYRLTPAGRRVSFSDAAVAAVSRHCAALFQVQRSAAEGHPVTVRDDVGYDLGTRGLAPGDMWMVQLLADVPWVYNEAGGNSRGTVGLDPADRARYAAGLVAGVEACVPRPAG